jgi:iron complex outermembrane receptor protein
VTATTYAPPFSQVLNGTARLSGGNILTRWQRTQGEGKDFQVQFYYDRTNRHEPNFTDLRDTFDVDFLDRFCLPARQQISWGFGTRFSTAANPTVVSGLFFLPQKRTDKLLTGFLEDDIELLRDRLTLSLGTKLLNTNYTGTQWQPSARLLWTRNSRQTFWASYTHAVRTPSAAERAIFLTGFIALQPDGTPFFARFNANPHFGSEQLNGYELGYRQLYNKTTFIDVAAFYNHYNSLFSEDIVGAPFVEDASAPTHLLLPAEFGNGLHGTTKGAEIAPEWRPESFLRLRASYAFLQMRIKKNPNSLDIGSGPFIEGSSPRHQATAQAALDFAKTLNFDLTYRYVSALPALKISSYSTADARLGWWVRPSIELSVVGQNLLQPHHYEFASDPGPNVGIKRSVYGKITWWR